MRSIITLISLRTKLRLILLFWILNFTRLISYRPIIICSTLIFYVIFLIKNTNICFHNLFYIQTRISRYIYLLSQKFTILIISLSRKNPVIKIIYSRIIDTFWFFWFMINFFFYCTKSTFGWCCFILCINILIRFTNFLDR